MSKEEVMAIEEGQIDVEKVNGEDGRLLVEVESTPQVKAESSILAQAERHRS